MFSIKWIPLVLFSFQIITITTIFGSPVCTFVCLNQTVARTKPPPIFINDSDHDVLVLFRVNCSSLDSIILLNVTKSIDNPRSIEVRNPFPLVISPLSEQEDNIIFNLTIHGVFLGYSQLSLHLQYLNENKSILNLTSDIQVDFAVKRKATVLDTIFTVIIIILVCIGTFLIGCRLSMQNLWSHLRRPIPILIGLFSQFLCLPLVREALSFFNLIFQNCLTMGLMYFS